MSDLHRQQTVTLVRINSGEKVAMQLALWSVPVLAGVWIVALLLIGGPD